MYLLKINNKRGSSESADTESSPKQSNEKCLYEEINELAYMNMHRIEGYTETNNIDKQEG